MNIIFLGGVMTGKTQLANCIQGNPFQAEPQQKPNFPTAANFIRGEFKVWDLSGEPKMRCQRNLFCKTFDLGVYCVDLSSEDIDYSEIVKEINDFKTMTLSVILVGTKSDLCKEDPQIKLHTIQEKLREEGISINVTVATSSKTGANINELTDYLRKYENEADLEAQEREARRCPLSPWQSAVKTLKIEMKYLPYGKFASLVAEIGTLEANLRSNDTASEKEQAIQNFSKQCHIILEGKYPKVFNSVLTLAAVAVVAVIVGLTGFGLGFAAGLWTGPGAFFTGFMAGSAAAASVVVASGALGLLGGGLAAYSLFKPSKASIAIDNFVEKLNAPELFISPQHSLG